jgi:protein crumbs
MAQTMKVLTVVHMPYVSDLTAATFGHENITESLVTVMVNDRARRSIRNVVDISMFIRTRQEDGTIFYLGSSSGISSGEETFILAQLDAGELLVKIQFSGTLEKYTVGGQKLADGYNHLIQVFHHHLQQVESCFILQ